MVRLGRLNKRGGNQEMNSRVMWLESEVGRLNEKVEALQKTVESLIYVVTNYIEDDCKDNPFHYLGDIEPLEQEAPE